MGSSCFVVMAIGAQSSGSLELTEAQLRERYTHLIKEAILKARPNMEVVRADDVASPGSITTDIFTRLMHSDYVVADITFPNPNVFYELGLRHACRPGTVLIRDKEAGRAPFDVASLRYTEYENTPAGLKKLGEILHEQFAWIDKNREQPDNQFLELAKLTQYRFQDYSREKELEAKNVDVFMKVLSDPETMKAMIEAQVTDDPDALSDVMRSLAEKNPELAKDLVGLALAQRK